MNLRTSAPHDYLIRTVRAGVAATWITLAAMAAFYVLAEDREVDRPLYLAVLILAALGVAVAGALPWDRLFRTGAGMGFMYAWSILDIILITLAITATGESISPLYVLFTLTTVFFSTAYPPAAQVLLLLFTYACVIVAAFAWDAPIMWAALITRLALLGAITYLTSFLSRELMRRNVELQSEVEEHTRAEEALRQSEAFLEEAQRVGRIGSWDWNVVTGELFWSDELYRIYGHEPGAFEPTYERFLEAVHPDDRTAADAAVQKALAERGPLAFEHRALRPDGGVRTLMARGRVQCNEAGEPVRMVGTGQDITDVKRAEETARALADLERRQQEALELNDTIVQGLAVAKYSLDLEHTERAAKAVEESLRAAKSFVGDLLRASEDATADLVREEPADVGVGVPPPPGSAASHTEADRVTGGPPSKNA